MLEGERAIGSISDAIQKLNHNPEIDIITIVRGGGRYQNLAVFDDVSLARTIAQSAKYIVTGIGHHKDSTLADQVADYVASTPTSVAHYIAKLCLQLQTSSVDTSPSQPTNFITALLLIVAVMFIIIVVLLIMNFQ